LLVASLRFGDGSIDNSASQETINSLPVTALSGSTVTGNCVICLEEFKEGDKAKVLECQHKFHPGCLDTWLKQSGTCPMCKLNIRGEEEKGGG